MPQNEVVSLPQRPGAAHSIADIEKLAEAVARSRMFGITTKEQALVLMAISQAEGRHPALAARDYDIIQGRPAKKAEAMMRDFLEAGGKVEWHQLDDDAADATFAHPSGGKIRILWNTQRAVTAGLAGRDMWKKFPRQMLRSRCVSEGVKTVYPMATSGFYTPEEVRDIPAAALPETPSDTTAELDQFAAVTGDTEPPPERDILAEARAASERGRDAFAAFWQPLSMTERDSIRQHMDEFRVTALQADDPFGLAPIAMVDTATGEVSELPPTANPAVTEGDLSTGTRDVFAELDREARDAAEEGTAELAKWWKTLRRGDADLIRALRPEYERLAQEADAQHGLAL